MPAAVIPIRATGSHARTASWSLVEVARPGHAPVPLGILLVDDETDRLSLRFHNAADFERQHDDDLDENEADILDFLADDLRLKSLERGGRALLDSLEDSLSNFLRIGDRSAISYTGDPQLAADRLFDEYVDAGIRPFVRHLPFYTLRAAATKFGDAMDAEQDGWRRVPEHLRLTPDMFIAQVVGPSMEPLIPDGSFCVFRHGVVGSRQGKRLLIELFGETNTSNRYTVKRYTSRKTYSEDGAWQHERIRLEPLNREFEAFEIGPDDFRVIAEFVAVLPA
jgi:hypothetical protein